MPATIKFTTWGGRDPFADDPPYASEFYAAIGRLMVMWGKLEGAMDMLAYSARTIISKDPYSEGPRAGMNRKIRALRKAFRSHPSHANNQVFIRSVLLGILKASKKRNAIVHGICHGFLSDPSRIEFHILRFVPGDARRESVARFTLAELDELTQTVRNLDQSLPLLLFSTMKAPRSGGTPPPPVP
jgi:hypothetical protein